jgi:Flp pilus assembly pilin Flp
MLIARIVEELKGPDDGAIENKPESTWTVKKRGRRAATAMEYLVCASFILVVVISAVQYFGSKTNQLMDKSATATSQKKGP